MFINEQHREFYEESLKKCRYQDVYHKALCYCLGICEDTRRNIKSIYDFKTGSVKTECLHEGWQTSGSARLVRLAFNLYNNGTPNVYDYEDDIKPSSVFPMRSKYNNTFGAKIGNKKLVDIHNIDIQNVINQLVEEGKAASSIRDALGRVRDCMESAKNNRIISINPCFDVRVPTENKKVKRRFLSVEEQNTFLKQAQQDGDWYFEMFCIMFLTGVRVGELGGLQWSDVDFEQKCIRINRSLSCQYEQGAKKMELTTPKTHNSYRTIPFMVEAEEMFLAQKKKQEQAKKRLGKRWSEQEGFENLIFTTSLGSPVTRHVAEKQINKVVEAINYAENVQSVLEGRAPKLFEPVHPHALRHTFASRCFEQNMNPKVVQAIMGHQHYSTTIDIYTYVTEAKYKEEIEKFGKV